MAPADGSGLCASVPAKPKQAAVSIKIKGVFIGNSLESPLLNQ